MGVEPENDYYDEPRNRYSLSDMITHIKRSIPDLRSIKHQPLQNKESPLGSPRTSHCRLDVERNQSSSHRSHSHSQEPKYNYDKETNAITLSAATVRTCTCGTTKEATNEKNQNPDESDAFAVPHSSNQHSNVELR